MNKKLLILLIVSYLLAFSINLMPAIKHPDLQIGMLNFLVSLVFMAFIVISLKTGSQKLKKFIIGGTYAGIVIFFISELETYYISGSSIFDAIASIQYPLYVIFVTPLFGMNLFLDTSYEVLSIMLGIFYAVVWCIIDYFQKKQVRIA
ncbi:hypothetical protein [Ureibacillus chungkukjangi]|uniref:Uncharacterized protein n=1 Tax=Ureibacillus chungkukjangi TaxID=1202712 RepID=A0A318U1S7_9BACL|nr:hypothetical protein [Ureibacillus chungkukjangi]PYF08325.1 hypothetical protein BJ095_10290 [Ureibacillus chungkukjangi]